MMVRMAGACLDAAAAAAETAAAPDATASAATGIVLPLHLSIGAATPATAGHAEDPDRGVCQPRLGHRSLLLLLLLPPPLQCRLQLGVGPHRHAVHRQQLRPLEVRATTSATHTQLQQGRGRRAPTNTRTHTHAYRRHPRGAAHSPRGISRDGLPARQHQMLVEPQPVAACVTRQHHLHVVGQAPGAVRSSSASTARQHSTSGLRPAMLLLLLLLLLLLSPPPAIFREEMGQDRTHTQFELLARAPPLELASLERRHAVGGNDRTPASLGGRRVPSCRRWAHR
jgi:hypothetical protein